MQHLAAPLLLGAHPCPRLYPGIQAQSPWNSLGTARLLTCMAFFPFRGSQSPRPSHNSTLTEERLEVCPISKPAFLIFICHQEQLPGWVQGCLDPTWTCSTSWEPCSFLLPSFVIFSLLSVLGGVVWVLFDSSLACDSALLYVLFCCWFLHSPKPPGAFSW